LTSIKRGAAKGRQNPLMVASAREIRGGTGPSSGSTLPEDALAQARLVAALCAAATAQAGGTQARVIETHISYVLLTGRYAYKIKKAVCLGFLDFRTLAARHFYCDEELRLNRRLAPDLYLDVIALTGSIDAPVFGGSGPVIEYAVRMSEFPQAALASHALARGELSAGQVTALAGEVATFHRTAARAPVHGHLGAPDVILGIALQNFAQLRPLLRAEADLSDLDALEAWTREQHAACAYAMAQRRDYGFIRECHGDLHLGNIAVLDGKAVIFDCIEFNDEMRWIDVMSEVAFTTMDLRDRGRPDLAHRFLDAYLEITGDFAGLGVLRFYLVYRAMVRAKIARLRAAQCEPGGAADALIEEYGGYVRLAKEHARTPRAAILLTHGLSGSGKTTVAQALLEAAGAVRIRTDVERKRLHGLDPGDRGSDAGLDAGLYAPAATQATYRRSLALAQEATGAGYVAIVDGAFLKRWQRRLFQELAARNGVALVMLACTAPESVLRERIARRHSEGDDASDADLAVLDHQLRTQEPLAPDEMDDAIIVDTEARVDAAFAAALWQTVCDLTARFCARDGPSDPTPASLPVAP
jgi:aminoglycoside phosphotransferase family enzyme/predicted kinase